jgi:subtilase family serine protease
LVALALAVVIPGGIASHAAPGEGSSGGPSSVALATDALPLPSGAIAHPLDPSTPVNLVLTLPYSNDSSLSRFLAAVETPSSPEYRHFLTAAEFDAQYSPSRSTVARVEQALTSYGGTELSVAADHATVSALLPARAVHAMLGIQLTTFGEARGTPLYTAVGTPRLPPGLAGLVSGIGGLTDAGNPGLRLAATLGAVRPVSDLRSPAEFVLNGTTQWLVGPDFTQAYGATALFPGGSFGAADRYPSNIAIATLLASSYNVTNDVNLPPWDPNVVDTYFNNSSSPAWPRPSVSGMPVTIAGVTPPVPGSLGAMNDDSGDEFENSLDLEMAGSLAPGADLVNFYFAGSLVASASIVSDLADDFATSLSAALGYSYPAGVHLGVVSGSFGLPDLNDSAWNSALQQAAAMGVTVVCASGDQGNAPDTLTGRGDGQWPVWPASSAFNTSGVVAVGGVSLTLDGRPTTSFNGSSLNVTWDSNITGIAGMTAWWDDLGRQGSWAGSEGGLSTVIPEPYWQNHSAAQPGISNAAGVQGATLLGRAEPDVAFPANDTLAYVMANATGALYFGVLEGTSIAAPVFAGLVADEASVTGSNLGYLDPEIYRIGSYFAANPGSADPFLGVTQGANYVFSAGAGWNAVAGWGGLAAGPFYLALGNSTVNGYVYTGPTPGLPSHTSSNPGFPVTVVIIIVGLAVAAAIALAVAFGRPRAPPARAQPPPWGAGATYPPPRPSWEGPAYSTPAPPFAPGGATALPPMATFQCPYCGSPRPAEPVRCPRCGQL